MNPPEILLQVEDLSRNYGMKTVFSQVSLNLHAGDTMLVRGANGSGKTTFMRIIAGLLAPTAGTVKICGRDIQCDGDRAKQHLGWASADSGGFFPRFTGEQNLALFAKLRGVNEQALSQSLLAWQALPAVNTALKTPFFLCSTGMKQLLNLIRSSLHQPQVLLWDEPLRGLDDDAREFIRQWIDQNAHKRCLIFSSHEAEAAITTPSKILCLSKTDTCAELQRSVA